MTMTYYELKNFWENAGEREVEGWEFEPLSEAQSLTLAKHIGIPLKKADFAWELYADWGVKKGWVLWDKDMESSLNKITSPPMWRFYNIMTKKIQNWVRSTKCRAMIGRVLIKVKKRRRN